MGSLGTLLRYPDDIYPLLKMKRAIERAEKQIPPEPHWGFCYSMLHKVSRSFSLVIQQLRPELRNAVCVFYLVLRALDTVEDDTSIPTDEKLPILIAFHRGTNEYKVLMDQFHHVSAAFLELDKGYQEAIEEITKRMGAGMAKFICQEVETVDDYDEYCHYVAGLVGLGLSKLFLASGSEVLTPDWDHISNSMGLFLQKTNIIRDYLEDINEIPESRMFWPRKIWGKYADKLEDLKYEENSTKAVNCLNEMVTNALTHIEDCLKYMAALRDPSIFRFCAIPQIMAIGTLALCYNNVQLFRGVVKLRRGLTAKVIDRTKTMADVYGAFYDFSCMLKTKVDKNDPNASNTLNRLEAMQKVCRDTGVLQKRKSYVNDEGQSNVYLKLAIIKAQNQIPLDDPHLALCYSLLQKVSRSFSLVIQQLGTELRDAVCVFYLILRALDTVEDDTSIPMEIKVPILLAFHRHIYDRDWHFICGTEEYKVLMDQFHHVSAAFLELEKGYQEAIEDITKRMGAGMAKFISREVETVDEYDEYCHYAAGLVGLGLSKLLLASGLEVLTPDWKQISNSTGLFLQKTNIIKDYLEDINEIPKPRMFWPREIWGKYVDKLEDLKNEENSTKAVQCLNEMVTNALIHVEDCLKSMAGLRDPAIFKSCAIPQIVAMGTLALCYNNVQVFRGVVKLRRGLIAKVIDRTKTMDDVYGAFYDFSCMLKTKVDKNDPNAIKTLKRLEAIEKVCRENGDLHKRKSYVNNETRSKALLFLMLVPLLAILVLAYLKHTY
uniref:squalene synthase n=1 Tax=Brassica oleracea var. oleracea TaxID=109376 RepID=A0A0D3A1Y4_BRAOL